jgi:hypothetical protein
LLPTPDSDLISTETTTKHEIKLQHKSTVFARLLSLIVETSKVSANLGSNSKGHVLRGEKLEKLLMVLQSPVLGKRQQRSLVVATEALLVQTQSITTGPSGLTNQLSATRNKFW